MTKEEGERKRRRIANTKYDIETRRYITFMCKKGCKFYDNECTKHRVIRICAEKGLKNRD